jgi:hypothetical protein
VGPQKYYPIVPTHTSKGVKIGTGVREDEQPKLKPSCFFNPAPTTYEIIG